MCKTSNKSIHPDGSDCYRDVMDEAYILVPCSEHIFEPEEYLHILATLDVCVLPHSTQFSDPDGYNIVPIRMV